MPDPTPIMYLTAGEVFAFNREILRQAGQPTATLRDRGLLESAVQRPQNAAHYASADLVEQAALYMMGIAANHPFMDGNKRTSYISGMTFLRINRYANVDANLNDAQVGVWLEQVVSREMTVEAFIERLRNWLAGS